MLQRTTKYWPKLKKVIPELSFSFTLPSSTDANIGAANGLADLQEFHNIDLEELMNGQITNYQTGQKYFSNSKLTPSEALKVATAARDAKYPEAYVLWTKAALEVAKLENKDKKFVSAIKKLLKQAKELHDNIYMTLNFTGLAPLGEVQNIRGTPYLSTSLTKRREYEFAQKKEIFESRFDNLLTIDPTQFVSNDLCNRIGFFLRRRTQNLCRGQFERHPILEKNLKCIWLHHNNPYLKLGPFKFDVQHRDPEIAVIREFAGAKEIKWIKEAARGHMKSTPYVTGAKESAYSKLRTSKVMYMNEKLAPMIFSLSQKIEQATRYKMKSELYASENFQVMNYGIGGRISGHLDSTGGYREFTSENQNFGGIRVTTFMVYLSSVEAGGHTVFPQAGISVKPVEGDALFWFNAGSQETYDSRIYHLGCPVMYGNKWIANKWVKLLPQFKNYPCLIKDKHFSTMTKEQTF